ncbi:PilN domain-containing protein [bacterium]|nr:PilN domain-containing protein [bacterium]
MISQFTINLNKGEDLAERELRWRKRREIITLTILIIIVAVLLTVNIGQYQMIEGIVQTKKNIIADIERQLDSLEKTGKKISKEDVLSLAKLEKERVLWTRKLLALGQELPEEMALTYLEFKNNVLLIRFVTTIKGKEKEFDKVKEMIDKLRASPLFFHDFAKMQLKEQHRAEVDEQNILSFSVLCYLEKGTAKRRRGARSARSRSTEAIRG